MVGEESFIERSMLMAKRTNISASTRWAIFARDGFRCRYCGLQAGQDGIELHVDHVISLADGGDNRMDNLVSACQACNGGKGAKSLASAPATSEVIERIEKQKQSILDQASAMRAAIEAEKELEQQAVNLKCEAYVTSRVDMLAGEAKRIIKLCRRYGADNVLDWYRCAFKQGVREDRAIKYVSGIIRRKKEQGELEETD